MLPAGVSHGPTASLAAITNYYHRHRYHHLLVRSAAGSSTRLALTSRLITSAEYLGYNHHHQHHHHRHHRQHRHQNLRP
jgi:hypothetical protein